MESDSDAFASIRRGVGGVARDGVTMKQSVLEQSRKVYVESSKEEKLRGGKKLLKGGNRQKAQKATGSTGGVAYVKAIGHLPLDYTSTLLSHYTTLHSSVYTSTLLYTWSHITAAYSLLQPRTKPTCRISPDSI